MTGILASVTEWIINLVSTLGYAGIFLAMTIESASIPLPSEVIMGIGGYLVYKGEMNLFLAGLFGALGNVTGSTIMYAIGLRGGRPIIKKYGARFHVTEERFNRVDKWFERWGDKIVFIAQLLPVVRTFISLPVGILKISYKKFIFYTFTGAFIWCIALAYVSSLLGEQWDKLISAMKEFEVVGIVVILVLLCSYLIYRFYKIRKTRIVTDADAPKMFSEMDKLRIKSEALKDGKPENYVVDKTLFPDVWVGPGIVSEIIADEITRSPNHTAAIGIKSKVKNDDSEKGLSIRFPRIKKWKRDKDLPNTVDEIIRMFELRKG